MNRDIILGIVRHILTIAGGVLVTKGTIDQATLESVIGALLTLVGVGWSVKSKTDSN
jgi:hypothetical protein